MTYEEMLQLEQQANRNKRRHSDEEHRLQCACVKWFRVQYYELRKALFAVPNGGSRNKAEAVRLKEEGVLAGVSDLILLKSNNHYSALCIEMKTADGKQSQAQKEWQEFVEKWDAKYIVVRSIEQFIKEVNEYLKDAA